MNVQQIRAYRVEQERIIDAKMKRDNIRHADINQQVGSIGTHGLWSLRNTDRHTFVGQFIAHAVAANQMLRNLIEEPDSETCGPIESESGPGAFTVQKRLITTEEIGQFQADSLIWEGEDIDSPSTILGLDFLHPHGPYSNFPDRDRTEQLVSIQMGDLTYDRFQHIGDYDLPSMSSKRETVAEVCRQAGVAVVPVTFVPVVIET